MAIPDIRSKVIREEIDINSQENFFSKLIKGLMSDLAGSIKVRGRSVPHMIISTGDDILYLENKGQDMKIEPQEVSNEKYVYNYVPRGVVTPGGVNILTDQLTSPYTRGQLQFTYQDTLYDFTAEFRRMPVTMSVSIKYYLDSFTDSLEVLQYIMTHLSFIKNFQIVYLGQQIPCSYKFPENLEEQFNAEFDGLSQDSKYRTVEVQLEVESNLPVYYPRTAVESDLTIAGGYVWQKTHLDEQGNEVKEIFYTEEDAYKGGLKPGEQVQKISKLMWDRRPVMDENGDLESIDNLVPQRVNWKKPVK